MREFRIPISVLLALVVSRGLCSTAAAQNGTPRLVEGNLNASPYGQTLSYLDKKGTPLQPGTPVTEYLRGNGSRAGYLLLHGGIIPSSVYVTVGARTLRPAVDFFLDPVSGNIAFAEPVRKRETIRVSYRYVAGQDGARSPLSLPGFSLNFKGTSLNLAYGVSNGPNGLDFTTYGLGINTSSKGLSFNGLLYLSNPAQSNDNIQVDRRATLSAGPTRKAPLPDARQDYLIAQGLKLTSGNFSFRADYQQIGEQFNGFQAMKQANAAKADVMAQIAAMEKERGIRRLGFGTAFQASKTDRATLDWDRISDGNDQLVRRSFGFSSQNLNFRFGTQSVGENFSRFNDLREAERGQWARERGLDRSEMALGFNGGKSGLFNFNQNRLEDKSGGLSRRTLEYATQGFHLTITNRKNNASFARLNDLSDADKTALALDIRRQFNPNAQAGEVTPKDKEQIGLDQGLTRRQTALSFALGKQGGFGFNQFDIGDSSGDIQRRTYTLMLKNLSLSYLDQRVGEGFDRIARMSDLERSQFGNERGIHRTGLGLNLALNKTSSFSFSQLGLSDREGALQRRSFAYLTKGLEARLNTSDIDPTFRRIGDLAGLNDAERKQMAEEVGFRRMDFTGSLTSLRNLTLSAYLYDAESAQTKQGKSAFRHNLAWVVDKNTKVTALAEGSAFAQDGVIQQGREHKLYTLDTQLGKGYKLNLFHDEVDTVVNTQTQPQVTTSFLHFETDRSKPNNLMTEAKRVTLGSGRFEDTFQLDLNYRPSKTLAIRVNQLNIERGDEPTSKTSTFGWNWQVTKTINFNGSFAKTHNTQDADVSAKTFALSGPLLDNLNVTGSYSEVDQREKNVKAVSDVSIANAKPIKNLFGLQDASVSFKYAAVNDQQKTQSEVVSGRVQGRVDNHQVVMEYNNSLDPKGNAFVTRTLSFVSDRNEKLPIHFDLLYRARNIARNAVQLVRRYNVALKLDKANKITYTYSSLPEEPNGNIKPVKSSAFSLQHALTSTLNISVDYTTAQDMAKNTNMSKLAGLLKGKVDSMSALEVGYSVDINNQNGQRSDAHTVTFNYDQQLNGDFFLTISTAYIMYGGDQPNALQTNLDFKTRF